MISSSELLNNNISHLCNEIGDFPLYGGEINKEVIGVVEYISENEILVMAKQQSHSSINLTESTIHFRLISLLNPHLSFNFGVNIQGHDVVADGDFTRISCNRSKRYAVVSNSKCCAVFKVPKLGTPIIETLHALTLLKTTRERYEAIKWHPWASSYVGIISTNNQNISTFRLVNVAADVNEAELQVPLLPNPKKTLKYVDFDWGCNTYSPSQSFWRSLSVFVICEDGKLCSLCPVIPSSVTLPSSTWKEMLKEHEKLRSFFTPKSYLAELDDSQDLTNLQKSGVFLSAVDSCSSSQSYQTASVVPLSSEFETLKTTQDLPKEYTSTPPRQRERIPKDLVSPDHTPFVSQRTMEFNLYDDSFHTDKNESIRDDTFVLNDKRYLTRDVVPTSRGFFVPDFPDYGEYVHPSDTTELTESAGVLNYPSKIFSSSNNANSSSLNSQSRVHMSSVIQRSSMENSYQGVIRPNVGMHIPPLPSFADEYEVQNESTTSYVRALKQQVLSKNPSYDPQSFATYAWLHFVTQHSTVSVTNPSSIPSFFLVDGEKPSQTQFISLICPPLENELHPVIQVTNILNSKENFLDHQSISIGHATRQPVNPLQTIRRFNQDNRLSDRKSLLFSRNLNDRNATQVMDKRTAGEMNILALTLLPRKKLSFAVVDTESKVTIVEYEEEMTPLIMESLEVNLSQTHKRCLPSYNYCSHIQPFYHKFTIFPSADPTTSTLLLAPTGAPYLPCAQFAAVPQIINSIGIAIRTNTTVYFLLCTENTPLRYGSGDVSTAFVETEPRHFTVYDLAKHDTPNNPGKRGEANKEGLVGHIWFRLSGASVFQGPLASNVEVNAPTSHIPIDDSTVPVHEVVRNLSNWLRLACDKGGNKKENSSVVLTNGDLDCFLSFIRFDATDSSVTTARPVGNTLQQRLIQGISGGLSSDPGKPFPTITTLSSLKKKAPAPFVKSISTQTTALLSTFISASNRLPVESKKTAEVSIKPSSIPAFPTERKIIPESLEDTKGEVVLDTKHEELKKLLAPLSTESVDKLVELSKDIKKSEDYSEIGNICCSLIDQAEKNLVPLLQNRKETLRTVRKDVINQKEEFCEKLREEIERDEEIIQKKQVELNNRRKELMDKQKDLIERLQYIQSTLDVLSASDRMSVLQSRSRLTRA